MQMRNKQMAYKTKQKVPTKCTLGDGPFCSPINKHHTHSKMIYLDDVEQHIDMVKRDPDFYHGMYNEAYNDGTDS